MAYFCTYPRADFNFGINMKDAQHDSFKELYEARHEPENLRPIAEAYWRTVLLGAIIAAGLVIFFGIWEFSAVMSTMSATTIDASTQQKTAIDRTQLESALAKFSERKANFELSKTTTPQVTDPTK